jgi:hypothetical protein
MHSSRKLKVWNRQKADGRAFHRTIAPPHDTALTATKDGTKDIAQGIAKIDVHR